MAEPKTKVTSLDPKDFLNTIEPEEKRVDSFTLLKMFEKVTGEKAVMWGTSIVGFGKYHYKRSLRAYALKSEKSSQAGDWMLVGFSPRKQNLTLYIMHGNEQSSSANNDSSALLEKLGKHKTSGGMGGCLYINKLSDVDQTILATLIEKSFQYMKKTIT